MAPKRTPKSEENSRKETSNKEVVTKKIKNVTEVSSRTLRPRTQAAVESLKTETKVKSVKEKLKAGKKRSTKQPNGGEPEEKQRKLDAIEEEGIDLVNATSIYEFTANDINGQSVSLKKYKGHVCVIVNVASRCGHTSSNYKEFVDIYDKFSKDRGLRILAFPCNQFGKQEPGDNEKICEFAKNHNVKFDMFAKIDVNGKKAHPLWKYLTNQKQGPKGKNIDWNFTKFLVNKDGQVVERYKPSVKPSALVNKLEKLW